MPTYRVTVGAGLSVALPGELCKRLGIKDGTSVEFFLTTDGQVHFHAITGTARGFGGILKECRRPPVSIREMDDGIAEHVVEDDARIRRQRTVPRRKSSSAAE